MDVRANVMLDYVVPDGTDVDEFHDKLGDLLAQGFTSWRARADADDAWEDNPEIHFDGVMELDVEELPRG